MCKLCIQYLAFKAYVLLLNFNIEILYPGEACLPALWRAEIRRSDCHRYRLGQPQGERTPARQASGEPAGSNCRTGPPVVCTCRTGPPVD
jgi:hypothetical protein